MTVEERCTVEKVRERELGCVCSENEVLIFLEGPGERG